MQKNVFLRVNGEGAAVDVFLFVNGGFSGRHRSVAVAVIAPPPSYFPVPFEIDGIQKPDPLVRKPMPAWSSEEARQGILTDA